MDEMIKDLGVTGDVETRVRALFDEFRQATRNWQRDNGPKLRDLHEQRTQADQAGDQAKVAELDQQIVTLQQARLAPRDSLLKQLADVLNPEQIEKVKDVVIESRGMLRWITRDMTLTDEQKAKLDAIIKALPDPNEATAAPQRMGENIRALLEKTVTEVILTDAQRQALAAMTGEEVFFDKVAKLGLSDVQKEQIARFQAPDRGRRGGRGGPESRPASGPHGPEGGPPPGEAPRD